MIKIWTLLFLILITINLYSQNVGIGITTPLTKLHVVGTGNNIATFSGASPMWITLAEGANNLGYIGSFAGNAEDIDFGTYSGNALGKIHLTIQDVPKFTITPAGNIGIGEMNPNVPLNFLSTLGNKISVWGNSTNHYGFGVQSSLFQMYTDGPWADIGLGYGNSAAFTENVRFKGDGKVGIGTTTPNQQLEVNGAIKISDANATPAAGTIRFNPATKDFEGFDGTRWKSLTANNNNPAPQEFQNTDVSSNTTDNLGYSVKIWEDYVFVGVPNYEVGASVNQGAVKIYHRSILTNQYELFQTLTALDGAAGDKFGYSLDATSSTTMCQSTQNYFEDVYLVVGAPNKNTNRGSIYLFRYDYNTDQFITVVNNFSSSDGTANDNYGYAVSILQAGQLSGTTKVLVGAPLKTVAGNFAQGRAYVVDMVGNFTSPCSSSIITGFSENAILNMKSNAANSYFGSAIAIANVATSGADDILCAVGASFRNVNANTSQGIVYMFRYGLTMNPGWYDSIAVANDGNALDYFGNAISIANDGSGLVAIGANYKENGANASQGAVYFFKDTTNPVGKRWWVQKNKFTAEDGTANDHFGSAIDWRGDNLMVGSSNRDDAALDAGAFYLYQRIPYQEAGIRFKKKITDFIPQAGAMLGKRISQSDTKYVFGVPDWDAPSKVDAGKIIIGDIFY